MKKESLILIYLGMSITTLYIVLHNYYIPGLILFGSFIIFKILTSKYISTKLRTVFLFVVYVCFFYGAATVLHLNIVVLFIMNLFFIKLFYYFYEVVTLDTPLESYTFSNFMLYFFFLPFLFLVHVPISYTAFINSLSAKLDKVVLWRGIKLTLFGVFLFSLNYWITATYFSEVSLFGYIIQNYTLMSSLELFGWLTANFVLFFYWIAGSVHITIGVLNICGFDLYPGFNYVFLSHNLLEFWRRWHIYFREFLVSTIFYPVSFYFVRRGKKYSGVFIAGLLTFVGATFFHLLPMLASESITRDHIIGVFVCDNCIGVIVALMLVYERAKFEHRGVNGFSNRISAKIGNGITKRMWKLGGIAVTLSLIIITDVFRCVVMEGKPFYDSIVILKHLFGM
jgi:hypothetical protein